jgi:hypothetical protein
MQLGFNLFYLEHCRYLLLLYDIIVMASTNITSEDVYSEHHPLGIMQPVHQPSIEETICVNSSRGSTLSGTNSPNTVNAAAVVAGSGHYCMT